MHVQPVSGQYVTVVVLVLQISRGADMFLELSMSNAVLRRIALTLADAGIATPAGGRGPAQVLSRDCREDVGSTIPM